MTKNIQSIVNYCILNSCTSMGGARSDVALALLFLCSRNSKFWKKAQRMFKQEQLKALKSGNWNDKLKMLLHTGMLVHAGVLDMNIVANLSSHIREVHNIIRYSTIQKETKEQYLTYLLFHFIVFPLYGICLNSEEEEVLLHIGAHIHHEVIEREQFFTNSQTLLFQLYLIVAILNRCDKVRASIVQDMLSLNSLCRWNMSPTQSALIKFYQHSEDMTIAYTGKMSLYQFKNIMMTREMTDYVLGELLCNERRVTDVFVSDDFLTESYLASMLPKNNGHFSLSTGLSRILLTYALALRKENDSNNKKTAMILLTL